MSQYLIGACPRYFGRENWGEDGEVLQEWTGIMAYTPDAQPVVGEAPGQKGLFLSVGFNGHGELAKFVKTTWLIVFRNGTYVPVGRGPGADHYGK